MGGDAGVDMPIMGAGSSGFDLLGFWNSICLGPGTEDAQKVACACFGWNASAAGPERIFNAAALWSTALKNCYSVWMVELMVFLEKNKTFLPSTEEVVAEIARRKKANRAAKAKVRAAMKTANSATAASSGSSSAANSADEVSDEESDHELPLEDNNPLCFSEEEVQSLLNSIAEFRGGDDEDDALLGQK